MKSNRRTFLLGAAATFASATAGAAQSSPSGTISLMSYGGIFQDNYVRAVVEPFQKAFPNIKVNYVNHVTSAQMLGRRRPIRRSMSCCST